MLNLIFNWGNALVIVGGSVTAIFCCKKYKKTHSRALLNCLPGVFTSLGLLGTFLAICFSLNGLGGNEVEVIDNTGKTLAEVKAASSTQNIDIMKIISELIPAFTSSIVGLIGALVATVWTKCIFAKEDAEEDKALENKRPEEYIQDIAKQSGIFNTNLSTLIRLHQEQEEKIKEYNDKLSNNINNQNQILQAFIDGFVNRMDQIFQQMHGAIQQQVQNFGEEQFTKTSQLLTSITDRLSNVSNEIINSQRQSVESMMNDTNEEIKTITTSVTNVLNDLTTKIQGALTTLNTEQADRLNNIITNYDALATKLSEQNSDFATKVTAQMQVEFDKVQDHNVESLKQMVDLKDAYQEAISEILTNTLSMNEKATADLRDSMSGFVANIQNSIAQQCKSLSSAITANVESLNAAYNFVESLVGDIRQNYDQAVLAYRDVVTVAHRTNEASEKVIVATNNSLKNVEDTNQKICEVLNILTERQENIEQLTKQISHVSSTIVELQKLENMLNKLSSNR